MSTTISGSWSHNLSRMTPKIKVSDTFIRRYANFMFIISILNLVPLLFKCYRVYNTGKAHGYSLWLLGFQGILSLLWIFNALITGNGGMLISTTIGIVLSIILIVLVWRCNHCSSSPTEKKKGTKE